MGLGPGSACDISMNTVLTPEQRQLYQNNDQIRKLLREAKTVAVVGLSSNEQRASYFVATYLKYEGYRIIPVNPRGGEILGENVYTSLNEIPEKVDIVNIFRPGRECLEIAKQSVEIKASCLWFQLKIINFEAAKLARESGMEVVMDKCIKMEHGRYGGSLHWAGMNTEIITAKKR